MDKYEISLWEDFPSSTSAGKPFLDERKICVIGSDTMTSATRALEPKLVSNVNGTHTFTFRIYYRYKDEITGEENINPYLPYIINERKVKVLWKDEWYDLVIKKMEEDTQKRSVVCTCEDLFITELSKNGYELEFNSELQNNSGTAFELMEKVLEGSGWQPASEQDKIIQYHEEPVYEIQIQNPFQANKQVPNNESIQQKNFNRNEKCLLFQSCVDELCTKIQFFYDESAKNSGEYTVEENGMLVLNGDCYTFDGVVTISSGKATIRNSSGVEVFYFDISDSYSSAYRAKRLVNSQLTVFDDLLGRYVDVYTDRQHNNREVYGYETTEYSDPTLVVNLIANSKDFKDTNGWIGNELLWKIHPSFEDWARVNVDSDIGEYQSTSYLRIKKNTSLKNTGLVSNKQYLTPNSADIKEGKLGGFQIGDKYIFRYKAVESVSDNNNNEYPTGARVDSGINCRIGLDNNNSSSYFSNSKISNNNDEWVEYELICNQACPANKLDLSTIYITNSNSVNCWIQDIQLFKLITGVEYNETEDTNGEGIIEVTEEPARINPGELYRQAIVKTVYRYYLPDHGNVKDPKDLEFLYQGETKSSDYIPVYNNYEKITSIEESKSNRFNILQSIAEKFECWVRFIINHNQETGQILYDENGLPQKYVQLVEQIGEDTGISFEYGIDLKGIKRTIVSNSIATKAIIIPNDNEFGKSGFCTIARSPLNYCRENFILNFDYYIQQGLLDKNALEADLYKTNNNSLGYYYNLNRTNKRYDVLADEINFKQIELTKKKAEYKVQSGNLRAAEVQKGNTEADLMLLAGVTDIVDARDYANSHMNNRKVQSLMGTLGRLQVTISKLQTDVNNLSGAIDLLEKYIIQTTNEMNSLVDYSKELHEKFFQKYSRFIQEGTWQDQNYVNDDDYYLDALQVAYRSSRPQIQYDISLLRLSGLEDFSSKTFDLGDICYVQDKEFFGYEDDGITPYKQRIIISQLTSYFDTPEKDVIKVQNYATQFDDLFQRITTATQALQFAEGSYARAASVVKPDKTLSFGLLQDTFDYNKDLVLNSANQQVTWDNTGITVADETNSALKVKIMAGGIFASDDGGNTWKNALRGDGISTDLLTAGRINTSEIYVYDGQHPSFRWDSNGINAYTHNEIPRPDSTGSQEIPFARYVRFDQFGIYGYAGTEDFVPNDENEIWYEKVNNNGTQKLIPNSNMRFGLTWKGFFLHGSSGLSGLEIVNENDEVTFKMTSSTETTGDTEASLEISTDKDIILKTGNIDRIQIGRYYYPHLDEYGNPVIENNQTVMDIDYGIFVRDENGENIFNVSADGTDTIGGWNLTKDSFYHTVTINNKTETIGLYSQGKEYVITGPKESYSTYNDQGGIINTIELDGHKDTYYILAGDKFGVTVDGKIYSASGRIGGWNIETNQLSSIETGGRSIIISSSGSISVNDIIDDETDPEHPVRVGGWSINANGSAVFHNIDADRGTIAGWHIDTDRIWNDDTTLSASSGATYGNNNYTIVTNNIAAYGGLIGGCTVGASSISGGNWSLGPSDSKIGGWIINATSLSGDDITLYKTGSIDISDVTLTGHKGGGLSINKNVFISGAVDATEKSTFSAGLNVSGSISFYENQIGDGTNLVSDDVIGLHGWKKLDGSYYKPADVGL